MFKSGFIKKADIVLALILLILGMSSLILLRSPSDDASKVEITVNGNLYGTYELYSKQEIEVTSEYGYNKVVISSGEVYVSEADCKGHDCMSFGHIKNTGEVIACAPHRMLITIVGGDGVDSGAY